MTHRNRALLDLAHEAPCFLQLGALGCGEYASVPAHSDMIRHGRGEKHKSHDCFAVSGCPGCHALWTRANLGKEGYHDAWVEAIERYLLWLWISGRIQVTAHPKAGKEPSMEAPHCKICDHKHWAREPHILPANAKGEVRSNTRREGRDVLKGAKPTSTASTERPDPPQPPAKAGTQTKAAKVTPGKRKTAPKKKAKKGKKKCSS